MNKALQRKFLSHVFMDQNQGDGSGNGGGTPPAAAAGDADIARRIKEAVDAEVAGLKAKNTELLSNIKTASDKLKAFEGFDPTEVRNIMQRINGDAEARLIAEGKIDEVLDKRTERLRADYDKKFTELQGTTEAALKRAQAYEGRVLDDAIRAAAVKVGVHAHAVEDALFRGRVMFRLNDNGEAVAMDRDNQPLLGKDGKTPLTPAEWLESMKEAAPHWFPAGASGAGASGNPQGGSGNQKVMKRSAFERLDDARKVELSKAGIKLID